MRPIALVALLLILPLAPAQAGDPLATLDVQVLPDHDEAMTLTLDGLRRLTRYQGICLPERARETRVHDAIGDVPYDVHDEGDRRVIEFTARSERLVVDLARDAPPASDAPLFAPDVNFCVPADANVVVNVEVPQTHTLFFLSGGGTIQDARRGSVHSDGPTHVFYSYEAPSPIALATTSFDEGPFRVFARGAHAEQAREVARLAAGPLRDALAEAGLAFPFDHLRVLYQEETPFTWEAGHYNGRGYVAVKESTLADDPTEGYPYAAVKVLVHESFHAASFPYGKGPVEDHLAWWLEGTARHAERQVDVAMPNASTHCERTSAEVKCWSFDDRITRAELDAGYRRAFTFDAAWEPSLPQSEETRRFYYGFSEFLVGAWIQQNGEGRYRAAWDDVSAGFDPGEGCPCVEGWLESLLADPDLFHPWSSLRASDPPGFEARVKPFVKDEDALQRQLTAESGPLGNMSVPMPAWVVLAAGAAATRLRGHAPRRRG